ncbi:phosphate-starvation-inducible PsiE family protein [Hydrogenovibrio marinus]|uniref:Uncharacterized protein n=1 Tax=Hydrogenovibrio marinus TaxID=28885 RepID=A0A066ZQ21_HYDMR|nr:phosphate-starvation-inducible PsiE family protein [Hydrogenovibrio marinus]KDN95602.1 hypothetical protein EI16_04685 [Hydrogenovibrio marinus]BBN60097.1 hypothetical protein HVMH_1691 [Hydrogenovibrio marinus]
MSTSNHLSKKISQILDYDLDKRLINLVKMLRVVLVVFMIVYLAACLFSISNKLFDFLMHQGALNFPSMKVLLTDALFTLIVLAIVNALFIRNSFDYALTFLEIAFVVVIRKLILLDTTPDENGTLLILGGISAVFFALIIYIHGLMRQWREKEPKVMDEASK